MKRKNKNSELSEEEKKLFEAHLQVYPPKPKKPVKSASQRVHALNLHSKARRGDVTVDFTVDLHGKTVDEAWRLLDHTLIKARANHWHVLRVITGKGYTADGGRGVLIVEIPARLRNDDRVAEVIQAVKPKDGGEGAWFVRVRL